MIGIIIPPGEIKKMVEKTASHVAKNGSQFEKALIEIEQNKPQFSFLKKENPYRAYYDHMVAEYSRKLLAENDEEMKEVKDENKGEVKQQPQNENEKQAQFVDRIFEEVKEPDPDKFSAQLPEKMTRIDMAMIQHTAQFVAVNGKNFLIALSERQKNNPQFEFLRSSSDNNQYFKQLVEAYTNIIRFNEKDHQKLQSFIESKDNILEVCKQAYDYYRMKQEQQKGTKHKEEDKNQVVVDWNDFQLVETIIFDDYKPRNGYSEEFKLNKPLFSNRNMEEKIISEPKKKQLLQQCHVCKRNILATEMSKHLKTCLGSSNSNKNISGNDQVGESVDVTQNLKSLSSRRPDIFGGQAQNIRAAQDDKNEKKDDSAYYDGDAPNLSRGSGAQIMLKVQQRKIKQQAKQSNK